VGSTNTWFTDLWTSTTQIVNTGQGIFAGLVAFGSQLWDAIIKGLSALGTWIGTAFKWMRDGLRDLGTNLGAWIGKAFEVVGAAISWVAQQIYNFGHWLYNSLKFVWNWLINAMLGIWEGIKDFFAGVATALKNWWGTVTTTVNTWWTNAIKGFRNKMRDIILANITIMGVWKSMEKIWNAKSTKDYAFGMIGIIASPIAGHFAGRIIDSVIPVPTTTVFPLIPTIEGFEYTPPSITIETPTEPAYPTTPPESPPLYPYTPAYEYIGYILSDYDQKWIGGQDKDVEITTDYETEVT